MFIHKLIFYKIMVVRHVIWEVYQITAFANTRFDFFLFKAKYKSSIFIMNRNSLCDIIPRKKFLDVEGVE